MTPPFREPAIPQPIAEQRPERTLEYDSSNWRDPMFVHQGYEWAYRVATKKVERDAEVQRHDSLNGGTHYLILLAAPMIMRDLADGASFRTCAIILHEDMDDETAIITVNGWLFDNHLEAREQYDYLIHPEKAENLSDEELGDDYPPEGE